jgi:hypothetical protein
MPNATMNRKWESMSKNLLVSKKDLHRMYVETFEELNIGKKELATLAGFGEYSKSTVNQINGKLRGVKGKMPTKSDVSWLKALLALKRLGFDVERFKYNEDENLIVDD